MCGVLGLNFPPAKSFEKCLTTLAHRGPDNSSIYTHKNHFFGHTRLAIIDLNDEANQPMVFEGIILSFNGEIYNYKELIQSEALVCKTKSDTEVIIRLYQKYGSNFLHLLQGMFAFSLYDTHKQRYFCARDRFGKKPFYYYVHGEKFAYASAIKTILAFLDKQPTLNLNALDSYLSFQSPTHNMSFFNEIYKLEAGHFLLYENSKLTLSQYYALDENIQTPLNINKEEALEGIEKRLHTALERRLVSDETIASFLSGGLDSSLISAMYSKISEKKIDTFSIGYDEHTHYSELPFAKEVSRHIDSKHHEIIMQKQDFINHIDSMLESLDEPLADSASIPTFMLSKAVHKAGIKVALSGEGSDECFLGYSSYFSMLDIYKNKALNFNESHTINNKDLSHIREYAHRRSVNEPIFGSQGETFMSHHKALLYKNYIYNNPLMAYKTTPLRSDQWFSYIDYKIWVAEVLMSKIDKMSMANSLELRAPFLDSDLVEFSLRLPQPLRLGNTNKDLLKQIAQKYLPHSIVHRQKKGFSSPFIEWLYEEYDTHILDTIIEVNDQLGLYNTSFIQALFIEGRKGKFKQHIWSLFIFAKWFKKVYM